MYQKIKWMSARDCKQMSAAETGRSRMLIRSKEKQSKTWSSLRTAAKVKTVAEMNEGGKKEQEGPDGGEWRKLTNADQTAK